MLAELLHLTRNLEEQGIPLILVHKDFGKPGLSDNTTLKAVLDRDGRITRLARLTPEEIPGLWTLKHGKKNFFPAVRLPASPPLNLSIDDDRWNNLGGKSNTATLMNLLGENTHPAVQGIDLLKLWQKQAARMNRPGICGGSNL